MKIENRKVNIVYTKYLQLGDAGSPEIKEISKKENSSYFELAQKALKINLEKEKPTDPDVYEQYLDVNKKLREGQSSIDLEKAEFKLLSQCVKDMPIAVMCDDLLMFKRYFISKK